MGVGKMTEEGGFGEKGRRKTDSLSENDHEKKQKDWNGIKMGA